MKADRWSALLVRVWLEDGPETFRARLTLLGDAGQGDRQQTLTVTFVSSPRDVLTAVGEWLDIFVQDPGDTQGDDWDT